MVSLHNPTCSRSIEQSFFDEDESGTIYIQVWDCENPLGKSGPDAASWVPGVQCSLEAVDNFSIRLHHSRATGLERQSLDDGKRPEGSLTYQLEASGNMYYDWQSRPKLHAFLKEVKPPVLDLVVGELGRHVGSLEASKSQSMKTLSRHLSGLEPQLTDFEREREVDRPTMTLWKIQQKIKEFQDLGSLSQRSVSNEIIAHSEGGQESASRYQVGFTLHRVSSRTDVNVCFYQHLWVANDIKSVKTAQSGNSGSS
jgi:hypothetical protein